MTCVRCGRHLRIRLGTGRKQAHRYSLKRQLQQRRQQVKKYLRWQKIDLGQREGSVRERRRGKARGTLVSATATTVEEGRGSADKWRSQALMHDAWCCIRGREPEPFGGALELQS